MAERLQNLLDSGNSEALAQSLDEDYEGLADTVDEWDGDDDEAPAAIAAEITKLQRGEKTITYRKINALSTNKEYIVG